MRHLKPRCSVSHLNKIEATPADKVKALLSALEDRQQILEVIDALSGFGRDAAPALPALKKLKLSTNDAIRDAATKAIAKIE